MSTAPQVGAIPLVEGQQSYDLVFPVAFGAAPSYFSPTVAMPNSSGEVLEATFDASSLTAQGVTIWLNSPPGAASVGGYINWYAIGEVASVTNPGSDQGITVVELFHRMGRRLRGGDFTKLSMTEQTDIANAANAALMRLYNALPTYFKQQTQGFVLPAPLSITNIGVTQYSKTTTGYTFSNAQFGQTVVLDGDQGWNQIIGENELLNPYMGETGTTQGTIYGNAIHSDTYPLDRIIGNPQLANQSQTPLFGPNIINRNNQGTWAWMFSQTVGIPASWWPQVFGNSQGKKPIMVIRFAPAPLSAMAVNVQIGFWPKRLTLADYDNSTTLCVPDQFIEGAFIPMCLQQLMQSPAWQVRGDEVVVGQAGIAGELFAKNQLGQIGVPNNRSFTPVGY